MQLNGKIEMTFVKNIFQVTGKKLSIIQYLCLIYSMFFIFNNGVEIQQLFLIIAGYFLFGGIGFSMMLHRYFTHRSFEFRSKLLYYIFEFISIISLRGSVIGWVYVHRKHHRNTDTEHDPHSPRYNKWKVFFPSYMKYDTGFNKFIVKDLLNGRQIFINNFYFLIILVWSLILIGIDTELFLYLYLIPISILHVILMFFIYFGHSDEKNDIMVNDNLFFGILLFGEGWHKNHHNDPQEHRFVSDKMNIDIIDWLIRLVKIND